MPLRLKSLELHGYKTFAAKTGFEFAEGITAIVGPNGSGKSNIADALRWVLGEQSYSVLRAKKTEDMIFAGSEQRPRAGMASALVTFDNTDGWLPLDFSEVALARRAYRDGRNEYLLNSQHVRLKDINELLAQSGLSERTYTILGQGLVDASLALKADDRRKLFEEAAGIGLYRTRREEALRRLETTRRNLDRVLDILAELEPRLKSLERQASRAQEFTQIQADLRVYLLDWYGYHWHHAQQGLSDAMEIAHTQEIKLKEAGNDYQIVRQEFTSFHDRLNSLRARLNSWHRQSGQLHEKRESVSGDLAMLDERKRALIENRDATLSEQARLTGESVIGLERLNEAKADLARLQLELGEAQTQLITVQTLIDERKADKSRLENDLEVARVKLDELHLNHARLIARMDELSSRSKGQKRKLDSLEKESNSAEKEFDKAIQEYKRLAVIRENHELTVKKAEEELNSAEKRVLELETLIKTQQAERASKDAEEMRIKAQLDVIEQAEQSLAGYAEGAKLLLEAARQSKLDGVRGALSASVDVPAELELAISAALGEYTDAVLLASGQDSEPALELLDSDKLGRATVLPLDWLTPVEPLKIQKDDSVIGVASELVRAPMEFQAALDLLLGQVIIVRDRATARRVLSGQPRSAKVVTLKGELFHATGQIVAGILTKVGPLGRPRQRRELQEAKAAVSRDISLLENAGAKLTGQIQISRERVLECRELLARKNADLEVARRLERQGQIDEDSARRQKEWLIGQMRDLQTEIVDADQEQKISIEALARNNIDTTRTQETRRGITKELASLNMDEFQEQVVYWGTRQAVSERALSDANLHYWEREQRTIQHAEQIGIAGRRLEEIEQTKAALEIERETKHKDALIMNTQLEELRALISPAEMDLESSEMQEVDLQKKEAEGQYAMARIERSNNQIQLDLGRKQEALLNLRQKIEDDFGLVAFEYATDVPGPVPLPFEGMVEQLPKVIDLAPDLEENMTRLRAQLRRMGAINPEAQVEFQSVKERHTFLTLQVDDLRKAEVDLRQVIAELDELTRREFQKTFDAVAEEFHTIFHRLFGGGSARLTLTDPDNLTETGIDIEARLPGRREQGLALLSGGERSLTAIALVFALLKVSPTPVCVLDEVDAMLDEANVGRFRDLLQELSKKTQFIIITHNRNTVQAADVIYGVTMGRDSVSQVIGLKLDEISEDYLK